MRLYIDDAEESIVPQYLGHVIKFKVGENVLVGEQPTMHNVLKNGFCRQEGHAEAVRYQHEHFEIVKLRV